MTNPSPGATMTVTSRAVRPRILAVIGDDCTGCNTCVDYCLVDCMEPAAPDAKVSAAPPVTIREDECIGCVVCAKVCEELGVGAIRLVSVPAGP